MTETENNRPLKTNEHGWILVLVLRFQLFARSLNRFLEMETLGYTGSGVPDCKQVKHGLKRFLGDSSFSNDQIENRSVTFLRFHISKNVCRLSLIQLLKTLPHSNTVVHKAWAGAGDCARGEQHLRDCNLKAQQKLLYCL